MKRIMLMSNPLFVRAIVYFNNKNTRNNVKIKAKLGGKN